MAPSIPGPDISTDSIPGGAPEKGLVGGVGGAAVTEATVGLEKAASVASETGAAVINGLLDAITVAITLGVL